MSRNEENQLELEIAIEKQVGDFFLQVQFSTKENRIGLLGPSGCGKSMTLKCIAGLEQPDRGIIRLGEQVFFDSKKKICVPARKRKIGYLFQNYGLFPHWTVLQNIQAGTREKELAKSFVEKFSLQGKESLYPHQLSGGQQQRVALARMLASNPQMILLDEPFSALDGHLKGQMEWELDQILAEFNGPSLLVSHDKEEAYRWNRVLGVIERGQLQGVRPTEEVFSHPQSLGELELIGCENIFPNPKGGYVGIFGKEVEIGFLEEGEEWIPCTVAGVLENPTHFQVRFLPVEGDLPIIALVEKETWKSKLLSREQIWQLRLPKEKLFVV